MPSKGSGTSNYDLEFTTKSNKTRHIFNNATTRRLHDRAVAALAKELCQLVDTADAPIFGIDDNDYVNEWNDYTRESTGLLSRRHFINLLSTHLLRQSLKILCKKFSIMF